MTVKEIIHMPVIGLKASNIKGKGQKRRGTEVRETAQPRRSNKENTSGRLRVQGWSTDVSKHSMSSEN